MPTVFIEPMEGSPSPARMYEMRQQQRDRLSPGRKIPLASTERLHSTERLSSARPPSADGSYTGRYPSSERYPSQDRYSDRAPSGDRYDRFPSADRSYTSSLDRSHDRSSGNYPYYDQVNLLPLDLPWPGRCFTANTNLLTR